VHKAENMGSNFIEILPRVIKRDLEADPSMAPGKIYRHDFGDINYRAGYHLGTPPFDDFSNSKPVIIP